MLTYEEALDYLYSFVDYSRTRLDKYTAASFDLGRMAALLHALGDPHLRYPVLHIAGTKGKGSVATFCASALQAAGYCTGLYTSPHLLDFGERIQVNGAYIPQERVVALVEAMRPHIAAIPGLTTFELITALGFWHFAQMQVEVAVVEVGLGGRLDATNVVQPLVTVITSLSYDHTHILGDTLAEIAAEKGGIIKPGVPLVTAPQAPEALAVLEQLCAERHAPLTVVGRDWHYQPEHHAFTGQTFSIWSAQEQQHLAAMRAQGHAAQWQPPQLEIALLGRHQVDNAAVAYTALQTLRAQGIPLAPAAIAAGLRSAHWPGRFQVLQEHPQVVVDGAHNRDSAQRLVQALHDYFPGRRVWLIFGVSSDKDVAGMLDELLMPAAQVARLWAVQAVHPRAQDPEGVVALVNQRVPVEVTVPVAQALQQALALAAPEDVILATGSLFVVSDALAAWPTVRPLPAEATGP